MVALRMDYICVGIIKPMLKLKDISKIIETLHRERTGISASLRTLIYVLCASTSL